MSDIEQYLRQNKPDTPDEGQFIIETNARLESVEGIKKTVGAERRRGRVALVIALVAGIVLGCMLTLFAIFFPLPSIDVDTSVLTKVAATLKEHMYLLVVTIAGCAIALGIVSMKKSLEG